MKNCTKTLSERVKVKDSLGILRFSAFMEVVRLLKHKRIFWEPEHTLSIIMLTWHRGTLFLPKPQTTLQLWPGNDSEQYPGKPGHVIRPRLLGTREARLRRQRLETGRAIAKLMRRIRTLGKLADSWLCSDTTSESYVLIEDLMSTDTSGVRRDRPGTTPATNQAQAVRLNRRSVLLHFRASQNVSPVGSKVNLVD